MPVKDVIINDMFVERDCWFRKLRLSSLFNVRNDSSFHAVHDCRSVQTRSLLFRRSSSDQIELVSFELFRRMDNDPD